MEPQTPPKPPLVRFAQVAVNRPLGQTYTYAIPRAMLETLRVGSLVQIPFGRSKAAGVVVDLTGKTDLSESRIKAIAAHLTPEYAIEPELIELGRWMAGYYFCGLGEALATISMIGLKHVEPRCENRLALADAAFWLGGDKEKGPDGRTVTPRWRRVIEALLAAGNEPVTAPELRRMADVGASVLKTLQDRGWLSVETRRVEREWIDDDATRHGVPSPHTLTPRQAEVYESLREPMLKRSFHSALLHGVTGSGKTEIYLRLIEDCLREGRTALVLCPEISLTPQLIEGFRERLGRRVGVYHSKLSAGQKLDLWESIRTGRVRVVIGARSALFSPLPHLGAVIVDEEHESAYKQGETPRYHARDTAVYRASRQGCLVVLGSATPSIESWHNAREGKYAHLDLPERVGPHQSPMMTVIDMKRYMKAGALAAPGDRQISPPLREAIEKRLEAHEQTVLLLNRRGFANHALCLSCEKTIMCHQCDVPMTYHKTTRRLMCHWCGFQQPLPDECPHCGQHELQLMGAGTQRIEETLQARLPGARMLRIDMDTMRAKGAFEDAWRRIKNHEVDIILGTQMIAKGLHLESVTLAGVISADFALFLPDFRAAERTYALLTQVAGRAGRGQKPGEVIIQSFMPRHFAIDTAARLAGEEFYERELHMRRILRFPPFSRLAALLVSGENAGAVRNQAERLAAILKTLAHRQEYGEVQALGPTPAPIARIEKQHRWRVLVRGRRVAPMHRMMREALDAYHETHARGGVHLTVDMDPTDLL